MCIRDSSDTVRYLCSISSEHMYQKLFQIKKMCIRDRCDDEQEARDQLRFQLEKSLYETDEEIVYEFSSGETAVRWLKKHPGEIDLLFLDVEMKEMTGMEMCIRDSGRRARKACEAV